MRGILILLLFVSTIVSGQRIGFGVNQAKGFTSVRYVPLPTPTDYGVNPTTTINTSMGSSIVQSELGTGVKHALVPNPYLQRLQAQQLEGTAIAPYYWKSVDDNVRSWIGGDIVSGSQSVQGTTGAIASTFHRFEHLGFLGNSSTLVTGITGANFNSSVAGTTVYYSDVVAKNTHFAGFRINDTDATKKYNLIDIRFARAFGYNVEGEGFYMGSTSVSNYALIENLNLYHGFVYNKGRDGFQFNSIQNLYVTNITAIDVGVENASAQRSLLQAQNVSGTIEKFVLWNAPKACVIAAHGLTIRGGVLKFNETGDIQDLVNDAGYIGSLMETGLPLVIEDVYFYSTSATVALNVAARGNNVSFVNCKIGGTITTLYADTRGASPTNTITATGTTTEVPPTPEFNSLDPDDESGLITTTWYRTKGWGYRN